MGAIAFVSKKECYIEFIYIHKQISQYWK